MLMGYSQKVYFHQIIWSKILSKKKISTSNHCEDERFDLRLQSTTKNKDSLDAKKHQKKPEIHQESFSWRQKWWSRIICRESFSRQLNLSSREIASPDQCFCIEKNQFSCSEEEKTYQLLLSWAKLTLTNWVRFETKKKM